MKGGGHAQWLVSLRRDPAVARCAPFAAFIAFLVAGSLLEPGGHYVILARNIAVIVLLLWFWPAYDDLRNPGTFRAADLLLAGAAGVLVFAVWIWLDHDWAVFSRSGGFDPRLADGSIDWLKAGWRWAGFTLVVPLMEELFWRSFLLRWLERHDFLAVDPRRIGLKPFLITTALFALEHNQWLAGAIAGAAYTALYMRSGNLWVPVLAHAVTNGVLGIWIIQTGNWRFW